MALHYVWKARYGTTVRMSEFIHRADRQFLVSVGKD